MTQPAQILIGCCLLDSQIADKALAAGVTAAAMPSAPLAQVWNAIIALRGQGKAISTPALALYMGKSAPMVEIFDCEAVSPTSLHAEDAIREVVFQARTRAMIPLLSDLKVAANAGNKEAIEAIAPQLIEVLQPKVAEPGRDMAAASEEATRAAEALLSGRVPEGALHWPSEYLDRKLGVIEAHETVCIAARPATGKTSLMLQLAGEALHRQQRVAYWPLETSDVQTLHQICAQRAGVDLRNLSLAPVENRERFMSGLKHLATGAFFRLFDKDATMQAIENRCRALKESWRPDVLMFDYMGLIGGGDGKSLYEKSSSIANRLVELRRFMCCPVVVAVQLNRASENEDRPPRLSDGRDSGAIEQAAHRFLAIYRPAQAFDGTQQLGLDIGNKAFYDSWLLMLKNRQGPIASVKVKFHAAQAKFVDP